ncbi:MAG: fluoride efflux transporter CrcB [Acidobacteriota bacterium]
MKELLWVGAGGFLGAVLRFSLSSWAGRTWGANFPFGTLLVNCLGCYALGVLTVLLDRQLAGSEARLFLGVGLLGALTTFSTFGQESLDLVRRGQGALALGNVAANAILGLGAVGLGWWTAGLLTGPR